jgi:ubiquinone/menaquinone biosynthesis C-methylase UbiE
MRPGERVLDVGCGTGSLLLTAKHAQPGIEAVGIDPDARGLARARRKAERAGLRVRFDLGFAGDLPYPDASFDRVLSSMMFHHLKRDQKEGMLREVRRVLARGGRLEFLDFSHPGGSVHGFLARLVHAHAELRDNVDERIVDRMAKAGFVNATLLREQGTLFGRVGFFQGSVPDGRHN